MSRIGPIPVLLSLLLANADSLGDEPPAIGRPFVITVSDQAGGRGVPLVELKTVNEVSFFSDSAGLVTIREPALMGETVFFHVKSHGYEFPADGFGFRGKALKVEPGGTASLKLRRINVAERLYRVTGEGIYRDTILAGRQAPIDHPLLNAKVFGSDSVLNAVYQGKLWWFWGDTSRPGYPLGNFQTPGAFSLLPGRGGLDPEVGVNLLYLTNADGFAAETAPIPGDGPTWLSGLAVFRDPKGREHMVAGYAKIRPPLEVYEHGVAEFDPLKKRFEKLATFPNDSPLRIGGHPFLSNEKGVTYINYADPFPLTRVKADIESLKTIERYEGFTCLETGSRVGERKIVRDLSGKTRFEWRPDTPIVDIGLQAKLIAEKRLKPEESPTRLLDIATGRPLIAHRGSLNWNAYRKRWVMIAVEQGGESSMLGEVWYAEADRPLGPWSFARKIVTHDAYSFYNPKQHPDFDKENGAVIFFEGTYTKTFSGQTNPTPRYDYNQILYKLRLDDPRLNLPVAIYRKADGSHHQRLGGDSDELAFFALEKPGEATLAVYQTRRADGTFRFTTEAAAGSPPCYHALKATAESGLTEPLKDGDGHALARVWRRTDR